MNSICYYALDSTLVADAMFDQWCRELVDLQAAHPDEARRSALDAAFHDFTASTAYQLPLSDRHYLALARELTGHQRPAVMG